MKLLFRYSIVTLLALSVTSCGYNSMVSQEEQVDGSWAQVENAYQRRADLIPNLVNTVKGAADFESSTLENVVQARANATSINISADELTEENLARFQAAQDQLSGALSRLMAVSENYPVLRANDNFLQLQNQLEGTENRISIERMRFNEQVQGYNTYIRQFPRNITANIFGFDKKAYFKSASGSERPPEVDFGNG